MTGAISSKTNTEIKKTQAQSQAQPQQETSTLGNIWSGIKNIGAKTGVTDLLGSTASTVWDLGKNVANTATLDYFDLDGNGQGNILAAGGNIVGDLLGGTGSIIKSGVGVATKTTSSVLTGQDLSDSSISGFMKSLNNMKANSGIGTSSGSSGSSKSSSSGGILGGVKDLLTGVVGAFLGNGTTSTANNTGKTGGTGGTGGAGASTTTTTTTTTKEPTTLEEAQTAYNKADTDYKTVNSEVLTYQTNMNASGQSLAAAKKGKSDALSTAKANYYEGKAALGDKNAKANTAATEAMSQFESTNTKPDKDSYTKTEEVSDVNGGKTTKKVFNETAYNEAMRKWENDKKKAGETAREKANKDYEKQETDLKTTWETAQRNIASQYDGKIAAHQKEYDNSKQSYTQAQDRLNAADRAKNNALAKLNTMINDTAIKDAGK